MERSNTTGPDLPAHDSSGPPDGDRIRVGAVGWAVLLLGGGWGELLLLTALGVGVVACGLAGSS